MPEVTARRYKTPLVSFSLMALLIAIPVGILAQAGGQGGRGGGGRGGAPAAVPAAPGAPPAVGGPPAAQGGQGRGGGAPAAAPGARGAAPVDVTGYWVAIVTEDWIERMAPDSPPSGVIRGGAGGGGRGGAGRGAAAPPPGGEQCRVYAAGGSMRVPTRLNITWADDNTLKIDMDAGTQTRLLRFNAPAPAGTPKSLQGYSAATWETAGGARGGNRGGGAAPAAPRWGSLNVVTTNMSGGYLLSSRSAYSENAVLTEYFTKSTDFGLDYLTVTASIVDGGQTRVTSSTFKKEPNGSKFSPSGCEIVR